MITKLQAMTHRGEFWHMTLEGADGKPVRCRVSGACKTWKTRPNDFRLPVKHGLKQSFYITNVDDGIQQVNNHQWCLPELWAVESELFRQPEDKVNQQIKKHRLAQAYGMGPTTFIAGVDDVVKAMDAKFTDAQNKAAGDIVDKILADRVTK